MHAGLFKQTSTNVRTKRYNAPPTRTGLRILFAEATWLFRAYLRELDVREHQLCENWHTHTHACKDCRLVTVRDLLTIRASPR
jgi:hypothetical protein